MRHVVPIAHSYPPNDVAGIPAAPARLWQQRPRRRPHPPPPGPAAYARPRQPAALARLLDAMAA